MDSADTLDGVLDSKAFDDAANGKEFVHLAHRHGGDEGGTAGVSIDQPVVFQPLQRFADRTLARPHLRSDIQLDKLLARWKFGGNNRATQVVVHLVRQRR